MLPRSMDLASRRLGLRTLRESELVVLLVVKNCVVPPGKCAIHRYLQDMKHPTSYVTVHHACDWLVEVGLLERNGTKYSLSYTGKDYLHSVRRYMIHQRLK
jgi:hypothetical protein